MIEYTQTPSSAINMSGLTVDFTDGDVTVTGSVAVNGSSFAVDETYLDVAAGWAVFVKSDGTLTEDAAEAFAHLCWFDGTDLHVIKHS